jgi:hypothetical protein
MVYTVVVGVSKAELCLLAGQNSGLLACDWSAASFKDRSWLPSPPLR